MLYDDGKIRDEHTCIVCPYWYGSRILEVIEADMTGTMCSDCDMIRTYRVLIWEVDPTLDVSVLFVGVDDACSLMTDKCRSLTSALRWDISLSDHSFSFSESEIVHRYMMRINSNLNDYIEIIPYFSYIIRQSFFISLLTTSLLTSLSQAVLTHSPSLAGLLWWA